MITDFEVSKAAPSAKPKRLYDTEGMYLEIAPSGGKWWRLKYRFAGKEKLISLGTYPDVSLADARDKRDAARKLLHEGTDPSAKRHAEKAQFIAANTEATEGDLAYIARAQLHDVIETTALFLGLPPTATWAQCKASMLKRSRPLAPWARKILKDDNETT